MRLLFNGKQVLELSEVQKKVIKNDIPASEFDADMLRRCKYWLESPIEKKAHVNRQKLESELRAKGRQNVPIKLMELAARHAEAHLPLDKLADIDKPLPCNVGDLSFDLSPDCRKAWRCNCDKDQEEEMLGERMAWILQHKYERCFERLKLQWLPLLASRGLSEIPSDPDAFAELVFSQPDYKDREARELDQGV